MVCWYCSSDLAQKSRYVLPASVMVYILRAGPPLEVSQLDSTMPSFSICRSVLYNVPGFIASNPKAEARSMSSYPYEFHSLSESRITGTSQFLGRASTPRNSRSLPPVSRSSLFIALSSITYVHFTYMYQSVKVSLGLSFRAFLSQRERRSEAGPLVYEPFMRAFHAYLCVEHKYEVHLSPNPTGCLSKLHRKVHDPPWIAM
jgi:hypothetical protein